MNLEQLATGNELAKKMSKLETMIGLLTKPRIAVRVFTEDELIMTVGAFANCEHPDTLEASEFIEGLLYKYRVALADCQDQFAAL